MIFSVKRNINHTLILSFIIVAFLGSSFFLNSSNIISSEKSLGSEIKNSISPEHKVDSLIDIDYVKKLIAEKDREISKLKNQKRILFIIFILTLLFFTILIIIILYKRHILNKRINIELENAYSQLEKMANYDPLTLLYNRASMSDRIEIEIVRMGRTGKPFSLIMFDIDDFKKFNDLYGRECGDKILESMAIILKENLRGQDAASRWGGEEFLVLLPDTGSKGGLTLAEKIRTKVEKTVMEYGEYKIKFTVTAGVIEYSKTGPLSDCLRAVDLALFNGKKLGKNRSVILS